MLATKADIDLHGHRTGPQVLSTDVATLSMVSKAGYHTAYFCDALYVHSPT